MKSREKKGKELKRSEELLAGSKSLVFVNFGHVSAEDVRKLRAAMKELGATLVVLKKRLLNIALKKKGIEYDARKLEGQIGAVFSPVATDEIASPVYTFFSGLAGPEGTPKDWGAQKILGGYDIETREMLNQEKVLFYGRLPSKEVLIGRLVGMLMVPLRSLAFILSERAEQPASSKE